VPGAEPPETALIEEWAEKLKGALGWVLGSPKDAAILERLKDADDATKDKVIDLLERKARKGKRKKSA